jgi:multiple sugar transport system substrate-binding protein
MAGNINNKYQEGKMKSRVFAAAVVLPALIALAGCSKSSGGQAASGSAPVKLTYWEMYWGPAELHEKAGNKLVKQFNDSHPNIQVEIQYIPWNNYYQTFLTAITGGAAPDVSTGATPNPIQFATMGESLDLDPLMEQWRAENSPILTDITEDLWKFFQFQGKQYGVAFGLDNKLLYYRTDFFEQAGITEMPKTWPELTAVLRRLKQVFPDKIPLLQATADNNSNHSMGVFMNMNQVGPTTVDLKPNFQSKEMMEVLEYIKALYDEELLARGSAGYISSDAERIYHAGEAVIMGYQGISGVIGSPVESLVRVMPPIAGPSAGAKGGSYFYCPNAIQGFNQSKDHNAARTFIKWWVENYGDFLIESGQSNFPARKSIMLRSEYQNDPLKSQVYKYVFSGEYPSNSMVFPVPSLYPQFANVEGEQIYGKVIRKILSGVSPAQAAQEGDAEMQQAIDTYKVD